MSAYSLLATLYLVYVGVNGGAGILQWPLVVAHAGLSILGLEVAEGTTGTEA
jgi:hypothetical protein